MSPEDRRQEEVAGAEAVLARVHLKQMETLLLQRLLIHARVNECWDAILGSLSVIERMARLNQGWLTQFLSEFPDSAEIAAELMRLWEKRRQR